MIGQSKLYRIFRVMLDDETLPNFVILEGKKGSGKKTFLRETLGHYPDSKFYKYWVADNKVDTIRDMITDSYKVTFPTIYVITDGDNMSQAAQNALLKVTEEPPNSAKFIVTVQDRNSLLRPIQSRGVLFMMDVYTPDELLEYAQSKGTMDSRSEEYRILKNVCEVPWEVDLMLEYGIKDFYKYVQLVIDNIAGVSTANAFKIADKLALKDDDTGYNLKLFLKTFCVVSMDKFLDADISDSVLYLENMKVTGRYLAELLYTGINRQMLFDAWILAIRKVWEK